MLQVRKSQERGLANHGWLKSRHTFSFADYYDPKFMGFKSLRVINEDRISGGSGFGKHPHRDMEIISYVVKGALEHQDTMGNLAVIRPGEVQKLSAGTGMMHSEQNKSESDETHFFQIWISPNKTGLAPSYGQKSFENQLKNQKLVLAISQDGRDGSIAIQQDADIHLSKLKALDQIEFQVRKNRGAWIQVIDGKLSINDISLSAGDAISMDSEGILKIAALEASEIMIFDLA
jgi:redox-sensitive bicupin YhaK (pirin superfamily)